MKYESKGQFVFIFSKTEGIQCYERQYEEEYKEFISKKEIYHLFDGKKFIRNIENGCISNYDGSIANIFVDGYESNLGIFYKGFLDGDFLVDKETFLSLCKEHKIEVNWTNK